jgi:adenosylcobyric acid synthase
MLSNGDREGAISKDNQVLGSYLHGIFDTPAACQALLSWAGCTSLNPVDLGEIREKGIELITQTLEENFDFECLDSFLT